MPRELYRVYVDETGDRGWGGRSSPIFVVTAVIVRDADRSAIVAALDNINERLDKPSGTVLHWAQNVKHHAQRKFVAREIGALPITLTSVIVMKRPMMGSGTQLSDATSMYNYAIRRLLERVSWYVDDQGGEAILTFAHVRRFPYKRLERYLRLLVSQPTEIRWHAFRRNPRIDQPSRIRPLQLADLSAGCIGAALKPDPFGAFEIAYLKELIPVTYVRGNGRVSSYGVNIVGPKGCMKAYPWWTDFVEACSARSERR